MAKNLTLGINAETTERAKQIRKKQGKSGEKKLNDFSNSLEEKRKEGLADLERLRKLLEPYQTRIKTHPGKSYNKEMIRDWRYEDYLSRNK